MSVDETVYVSSLERNRGKLLALDRWAGRRPRGDVP
jgi:hypothetical protein